MTGYWVLAWTNISELGRIKSLDANIGCRQRGLGGLLEPGSSAVSSADWALSGLTPVPSSYPDLLQRPQPLVMTIPNLSLTLILV